MENSTENDAEELEPWDTKFEVGDDDNSAAGSKEKPEGKTHEQDEVVGRSPDGKEDGAENETKDQDAAVDNPDIAVTRSPKPKKPSKKDKKKKNAKKKDVEVVNAEPEAESMEVADAAGDAKEDEKDEELEKGK